MQRVWLSPEFDVFGGIGSSWLQRYGVSRDERSGAWTLYDRRDSRRDGEFCHTTTWPFPDAEALVHELLYHVERVEILEWLKGRDEPALAEMRAAVLAAPAR